MQKPRHNLLKLSMLAASLALLAAGCGSSGGSYTNTTYHYTFNYPNGWKLYSSHDLDSSVSENQAATVWVNQQVSGTAASDFRFYISVDSKNPGSLSPDQYYATKRPGGNDTFLYPASAISDQEETTFAGSPAYKLSYTDGPGNTYFVLHDGVMFAVLVEENSQPSTSVQQGMDYIVNSFKFTD